MSDHYTAIAFDRFGEPGAVLARHALVRPELGVGELRLAVRAVGLNYLDATLIRGGYPVKPPFPATPGVEAAGLVIETGPGAEGWLGREVVVCPTLPNGALGTEVVVDAALAVERPDGVDPFVAAAMPVTYQTAWFALERARVRPGETVLISAGAGGVGIAATHLAKARGATVVTIVGGEQKAALSRAQGADHVIDRFAGGIAEQLKAAVGQIDVALDSVGAEVAAVAFDALAFEGRYVALGQTAGPATIEGLRLMGSNVDVIGLSWGSTYPFLRPERVREVYAELFAGVISGAFSPVISEIIELDAAPAALDALAAGRTTGKLVVRVGDPTEGSMP
jgi:NADPH2:quinone reductase